MPCLKLPTCGENEKQHQQMKAESVQDWMNSSHQQMTASTFVSNNEKINPLDVKKYSEIKSKDQVELLQKEESDEDISENLPEEEVFEEEGSDSGGSQSHTEMESIIEADTPEVSLSDQQ